MRRSFLAGLLVLTLSLPLPYLASANRYGKLGAAVVGGMKIEVETEEPEKMQGLMGGSWMMMEPAKNDTHHFEVKLIDPQFGNRIPYAQVRATFVNLSTGARFEKAMEAMFGKNIHYGANLNLPPGKYRVTLYIDPPTMMREGEALNKWLKPVEAQFEFTVN